MKHVKKIVVAIVLFVATTGFVNAQSKVAHIDVSQLLSEMPEMIAAQAELKKLQETYRADIEGSYKEFQNKAVLYRNESESKTKEENLQRSEELQGIEQSIQKAQQAAQQEMQKKQAELFAPISEKAQKAIEKVAAAKGVNYVLDATQGGGLIVFKGMDLLPDVKKELGF